MNPQQFFHRFNDSIEEENTERALQRERVFFSAYQDSMTL